jgi:hypothetical protein
MGSRQANEIANGLQLKIPKGPIKPDERALQDVIGCFACPHDGVVAQHPPRDQAQAFLAQGNQVVPRGFFAKVQALERELNLASPIRGHS